MEEQSIRFNIHAVRDCVVNFYYDAWTVDSPWTIPVLMMEPILEWVWFTIPVFTVASQRGRHG